MIQISIDKKLVVFVILLVISIILPLFFLNASKLTIQEAIALGNMGQTIERIISINFIIFALTFPITSAILIVGCRLLEKRPVQIGAAVAFILGAIISLLLLPNIGSYLLVGFFYFIALFLMIEISYLGFAEIKKYTILRVVSDAVGKQVLLLGIGIFILSALTIFLNQQQYIQDFENGMMSLVSSEGGVDYAEISAELMVRDQQQTLDIIMGAEEFLALESKEDTDVERFIVMITTLRQRMGMPEYKDELKRQIEGMEDIAGNGETPNTFDLVKESFPLLNVLEKFFWLMISLFAVSIFFIFGNLIVKPLSIIYSVALDAVLYISR